MSQFIDLDFFPGLHQLCFNIRHLFGCLGRCFQFPPLIVPFFQSSDNRDVFLGRLGAFQSSESLFDCFAVRRKACGKPFLQLGLTFQILCDCFLHRRIPIAQSSYIQSLVFIDMRLELFFRDGTSVQIDVDPLPLFFFRFLVLTVSNILLRLLDHFNLVPLWGFDKDRNIAFSHVIAGRNDFVDTHVVREEFFGGDVFVPFLIRFYLHRFISFRRVCLGKVR